MSSINPSYYTLSCPISNLDIHVNMKNTVYPGTFQKAYWNIFARGRRACILEGTHFHTSAASKIANTTTPILEKFVT